MKPTREETVRFLDPSSYGPCSLRNLIHLLGVKKTERQAFKRLIKDMIKQGIIVRRKGNKLALPTKPRRVKGKLMISRNGYGFVVPEERGHPDVLIRKSDLKGALHGDQVLALIEGYKDKGTKPRGRILSILERASKTIVGRYNSYKKQGYLEPLEEKFGGAVLIPKSEDLNTPEGYYAVAEITRYPGLTRPAAGRIVEVLGSPAEPNIEDQIVIRMFNLPREFPSEVLQEASQYDSRVDADEVKKRKDFRQLLTITVDPESARDFDDAVSIEVRPNGSYLLGVHIADVSHYVAPGSAIDKEAFRRGNSYYFTNFALPMLPELLSSDLCSLKPKEDRLTLSVLMGFDHTGRRKSARFYRGEIKSNHRMTYKQVAQILTGESEDSHNENSKVYAGLKDMKKLSQLLRKRRMERGSIDFDFPEPEILLNPLGEMDAIVKAERNIAHQLIEEFMLAANRAVANHLERCGLPTLYRIHEPPEPLKVEEFNLFLAGLGYSLPGREALKGSGVFQQLLDKVKGKPEESLIARRMLRVMKLARYAEKNEGHFALAFPLYTHFTSPIRRYPDLVIHRLLKECLWPGSLSIDSINYLKDNISHIAQQCSERERVADEAERELMDWKRVRFMSQKLGEEFTALISDITQYGIYAELEEYFVEGFIPLSTLLDDYYIFDREKITLKGKRTKNWFRLGQRIKVRVVRANMDRKQIEFSLIY